MIPFNDTEELKTFIDQIRNFFSHETDASLNLIQALATNHITQAKTVAELSLSKYFKRGFSSLFRAIEGFHSPRKARKCRKESRQKARRRILNFLLEKALLPNNRVYRFFLDITGITKKHSPKTADRSYVYSNGKIDIGHLYSCICLGSGEGWMLPMSMERIPSAENKIEFAVSQIVPMLEKVSKESLSICVGDSGYCCNKFIQPLSKYDGVVTITRVRNNKVMFSKYTDCKKGPGKKEYMEISIGLLKAPYQSLT